MARCGCSGLACNCVVTSGTNVTVSGAGTAASPYVISSSAPDLTFSDTATVDLTRIVDDITAAVKLDPVPGNLIVATAAGLRLDCTSIATCQTGTLSVVDTATVDLTLTGLGTQASPYVLSGVALAGVPTTVGDTNTVNLTQTGGLITADVIRDVSANNILSESAAGLLADIVTDCTLQGQGTTLSPLGAKATFFDIYQNLVVVASSTEILTVAGGGVPPIADHVFGPTLAFNVTNTSCRFMRVRVEVGISHLNVRKDGAGRTQFEMGARLTSTGGIVISPVLAQSHQQWMNDSSDATTDIVWDTTAANYLPTLFVMAPASVAAMTLQATIGLTSTNGDTQVANFQIFARITGFEV